jgi:phosphoglycerol transferase MdoB-like AlkP superfamily enzyme
VNKPWLSMSSGLLVISLVSLGLAILTAWQAIPIKGWFQGILWGVIFGGSIWVIFIGALFLNRLMRRKQD